MAAKGVNVPFGLPAKSVAEAVAAANEIGDEEVVIKSQILAGGRGLGTFTNGFQGGVHVIKSVTPHTPQWDPTLTTPRLAGHVPHALTSSYRQPYPNLAGRARWPSTRVRCWARRS